MPNAFLYVVDRDFGFAPNPFHGSCTLATCKPQIRKSANVGDWVIGIGGARLRATGHCIFAMEVTNRVSFDVYWADKAFLDKRPVRNGSRRMLVGDNIYHFTGNQWHQADSHHSLEDGTPNILNIQKDTSTNSVLISQNFHYFGKDPPDVSDILSELGYKNGRYHRKYDLVKAKDLLSFLDRFPKNQVLADPFDFHTANSRYTGIGSKIK